jgi:hypothetical protein
MACAHLDAAGAVWAPHPSYAGTLKISNHERQHEAVDSLRYWVASTGAPATTPGDLNISGLATSEDTVLNLVKAGLRMGQHTHHDRTQRPVMERQKQTVTPTSLCDVGGEHCPMLDLLTIVPGIDITSPRVRGWCVTCLRIEARASNQDQAQP